MKMLEGQSLDHIPMQEPCWESAEKFIQQPGRLEGVSLPQAIEAVDKRR